VQRSRWKSEHAREDEEVSKDPLEESTAAAERRGTEGRRRKKGLSGTEAEDGTDGFFYQVGMEGYAYICWKRDDGGGLDWLVIRFFSAIHWVWCT